MEIGTGIFLGSMFIGLVGLFAVTKDRWKWKRIFLWTLGTVAIAVVALGGWIWYSDSKDRQVDHPQAVTELWGLKLGMTAADVIFRKGEPTLLKEPDMWAYAPDDYSPAYRIGFRDNAVWWVEAVKLSKASLPEIQGIFESTTQEQLEERFGKPDDVTHLTTGFAAH